MQIAQIVRTLALSVHADFLPEATDIHQLIVSIMKFPILVPLHRLAHIDHQYELARAAPLLAKQSTVLATEPKNNTELVSEYASVTDRSIAAIDQHTEICLSSLLRISGYYAGKIAPDERSANTVLRRIAEEIEKDGIVLNGSRSETATVMQAETAFERLLLAYLSINCSHD